MFPLLAVLLALAPSAGIPGALAGNGVKLPTLAQLTRAVASGDDVEIERVAARFGSVRLERIAERGQRSERLAALRALPVMDDSWSMLPDTVKLLANGDADIAETTAQAVRQIAAGLSPQTM